MESTNYINSVNLNQNTDFPYLVLNVINGNSYPRNPGFRVMHWHEDIQFIYVLDGEIDVVTLEKRTTLHKGEGFFINKNVVHLIDKVDVCHYNSFIFPDYFLRFYTGSPAEPIVNQIIGREDFPVFPILKTNGNASVLQLLKKLSKKEFIFFKICIQYFRYMHIIWHIIYNYTHFIIPFKYSGFVDTTFLLN